MGKNVDECFALKENHFKVHSFKVESPNVTNNSLISKDDIQGKNFKSKDVAK